MRALSELYSALVQDFSHATSLSADIAVRQDESVSHGMKEYLIDICEAETVRALAAVDTFFATPRRAAIHRLNSTPLLKRALGKRRHFTLALDDSLTPEELLPLGTNLSARNLDLVEPLRIGVSTGGIATLAILEQLRDSGTFPLQIDFALRSSQEAVRGILDRSLSSRLDAVNLSLPCAARLLSTAKRHEYRPLQFMPVNSHSLITGKGRMERPRRFLMPTDQISSSSLHLDSLVRGFRAVVGQVEIEQLLHQCSTGALEEQATILWWPYSSLLNLCHDTTQSVPLPGCWSNEATVLFLHERFFRTSVARALNIAIRVAWLSLLHSKDTRARRIEAVLGYPNFLDYFKASAALSLFEGKLETLPQRRLPVLPSGGVVV